MSALQKKMRMLSYYDRLAIAFSILMFAVLLVVGSYHRMGGYGVETDFYWSYAPDAQRIVQGQTPQEPGVGPVYALTLAFSNLFVQDWFVSGKLLSMFSAVLCGLFTFSFIKQFFDDRLGFFTLVLWHATVLPWAIVASTDLFFAMLVAFSIYLMFRGGQITNTNLVLAGILMAVTYMTRHNAVVLPIGVVMIVALINPDEWTWSKRLQGLAVFAGAFALASLPWSIVQLMSSEPAVRGDSYLIIASHFYGAPGVVSSEDMRLAAGKFDSLSSVVFYDLGHFVKHYLSNLYRHFYKVLITSIRFPTFLFVAAGAFALVTRMSRKQASLFVFPALSFLLLCLVHYEPRYYLYLVSFFIMPAAYFLFSDDAIDGGANAGVLRWIKYAAFGLTVLFVLISSTREVRQNISGEPRELLEMAAELRQKADNHEAIIARKPHLGFLTERETVYFPEASTLPMLLEYAAAENAGYLLYGEMEAQRRPELNFLLEPDGLPDELEPIFVWDNPRTVVYKIRI